MEQIDAGPIEKHLLICVNERTTEKPCCLKVGGLEFFQKFKGRIKELDLKKRFKVTKTGCLGFCNFEGCTLVIHQPGNSPEWFHKVTDSDFENVWEKVAQS